MGEMSQEDLRGLFETLAEMVEPPERASWLRLGISEPISRGSEKTLAYVQLAELPGLLPQPLNTKPFAALDGLLFEAYGYAFPGGADPERAQPWAIGPQEWQGTTLPGITLNVVQMLVSWPGANVIVSRAWQRGQRIYDSLTHTGQASLTPAELNRAGEVLHALERFSERISGPLAVPRAELLGRLVNAASRWLGEDEARSAARIKVADLAELVGLTPKSLENAMGRKHPPIRLADVKEKLRREGWS